MLVCPFGFCCHLAGAGHHPKTRLKQIWAARFFFPLVRQLFRMTLQRIGSKTPFGEVASDVRPWTFTQDQMRMVLAVRRCCFDDRADLMQSTCTLAGLSKAAYWVAQWALKMELQSQLVPLCLQTLSDAQQAPAVLSPHISMSSLAVACGFLWRRYLFGLSIFDRHATGHMEAWRGP